MSKTGTTILARGENSSQLVFTADGKVLLSVGPHSLLLSGASYVAKTLEQTLGDDGAASESLGTISFGAFIEASKADSVYQTKPERKLQFYATQERIGLVATFSASAIEDLLAAYTAE